VPAWPIREERRSAAGRVITNGQLAGFDFGVDTDPKLPEDLVGKWATFWPDSLELRYPSGLNWGTGFITFGLPIKEIASRWTRDLSGFSELVFRMQASPGTRVWIGLKTERDPDNGREPTKLIDSFDGTWQEFTIPLDALTNTDYPASRFKHIYVVTEFIFRGPIAQTVRIRDVHFRVKFD
jgi:hypothetical protein